jgi:glutamine amidotransferase
MCRIAGYVGPPISLHRFLLEPEHSLYRQSWEARELQRASVNADGYGVAWYLDDGTPALYRNPFPVWADANLPSLARSLQSGCWLGNVRSATEGQAVQLQNTQPFVDDCWLFTHNGHVTRFAHGFRRRLQSKLDEDIEAGIQGNTDSEFLFALIRQQRRNGKSAAQALRHALIELTGWLEQAGQRALLNVLLSDGHALYAARHAIGEDCPTLYYSQAHPEFSQGVLVVSEPFDSTRWWMQVPPHNLLVLKPAKAARLEPL